MTRASAILTLLAALAPAALGAVVVDDRPQDVPAYIARLDLVSGALDQTGSDAADRLAALAASWSSTWRVTSAHGTFEVPMAWLRRDALASRNDVTLRAAMIERVRLLREEAAAFADQPAATGRERALLNDVLNGAEFQNAPKPSWLDLLRQRLLEYVADLLRGLFQTSAIPTLASVAVYGMMAIAVVVLAVYTIRFLRADDRLVGVAPLAQPPVREWRAWFAEAQAAADRGAWRDAIHLTYWCAVAFLESQGRWKIDRARTPREYVNLLPSQSVQRDLLATLTRQFEVVWYGGEHADAKAFAEATTRLKQMGCPPV